MCRQNCGWCQYLLIVTSLDLNLAGRQSPPKTECGLVSTSGFTLSAQNFALEGIRDSFSSIVYLFSDHEESPLETSDTVIMGQRTGEGGAGRKVWEGCQSCWGPLLSSLDVYPPHFSQLDLHKCLKPLPSQVCSLHSVPFCPHPPIWAWGMGPHSSWLQPPSLCEHCLAAEWLCEHQRQSREETKGKGEQKGDKGQELIKKEKQ